MTIAQNTNKIIVNQYLTPSPVFSRIESRLILSALLIGLLILTACGGALLNALEQQQNDLQQQAKNISDSFDDLDDLDDNDNGNGNGNDNGNGKFTPAADPDPNKVTYSDWAGGAGAPKTTVIGAAGGTGTLPLLNGAASVGFANPGANFIQGLPPVAGQGFNFAGTGFESLSVAGDILLLEAGSPSGVAFSNVFRKGYAGLLPGTNLGAPITDINTSAIWDAKFDAIFVTSTDRVLRYSNPDFKMRVTFNGSTGTINSGTVSNGQFTPGQFTPGQFTPGQFTPGEIVVSVTLNDTPNGNENFNIRGQFGRDGLLYGTVNPGSGYSLTGLIGSGGAVGAVVNSIGFAGGFVAKAPVISPDANSNIVNYVDWTRATTVKNADGIYGALPLLNGAASVGNANPEANFVQGLTLSTLDGRGFDFTGTDFASKTILGDVLLLEAGSPSGVAFSALTGTDITDDKGYAGLLPGTNLGAPITDSSTSAIWDAKFAAIRINSVDRVNSVNNVLRYSNPDFKMRVTFNGSTGEINSGTVSNSGAFTPGVISTQITRNDGSSGGSSEWNIQGKFGRDGLLYGTVDSTPLTGLIGQDGAVGAFVTIDGFVGGFVAAPQ